MKFIKDVHSLKNHEKRGDDNIRKSLKNAVIILGLFGILIILSANNVSGQAYSQNFQINDYYVVTEYSENNDTIHVNQTINIPLESDRWTITDLEMNFTQIQLERETKTIESGGNAWEQIKKGTPALGVEINVTESTELYGVEIHGSLEEGTPLNPLYIQIQGYNPGPDTPNGTILGETPLNMSTAFTWYTQMFSSPIPLSPGQYYLVFNGSNILPQDKSIHAWTFNDDDPLYPSLHTSTYTTSWSIGEIGKPFRHKLIQKVYRSYDPEEINMTAMISGESYVINNGSLPGTGVLNVSDLHLDLNEEILNIPVENNISVEMEFQLEYKINLVNQFYSPAQMTVEPGTAIQWSLIPSFERTPYNYSVEIDFPEDWSNVEVYRNGLDVTGQSEIIGSFLLLDNDVILGDATWEIQAQSPNRNLGITIQQNSYEPGQLLQFSIQAPHQSGNLTFFFVDSKGFENYNETKVVSSENLFSYEIPYNPLEGSHYAVVYWHNQTDAGVLVQEFIIIIPFSLTTIELALIIAGSVMLPLLGFFTVSSVRRAKRKEEAKRQKIFNKFQDVSNLEHIIIADKRTGLDIYDESISSQGLQASLVAGFLEAIRSFGIELTNSEKESQTIKLEYQKSKILMSEFKNLRTTLIMRDTPSQDFIDAVSNMSQEIEQKYHEHLENFKGNTTAFKNLNYFISKHLNTGLIYPLKLNLNRKTGLTSGQKAVVQRVKAIMKQNNADYFYASQLFTEKKGFQPGWGVAILKLIDKGIFFQKK